MSHGFFTGLDNGDGTFDMLTPVYQATDASNHNQLGQLAKALAGVGNTFYCLHSATIANGIKATPATTWASAILCVESAADNATAIDAMLAQQDAGTLKIGPVAGSVLWDVNFPPPPV